MKSKSRIIVAFMAMLCMIGSALAMDNATTLTINTTRWAGSSTQSHATAAGNISQVNITQSTLTTRWAAYSGNVSSSINLTDGTNNVFTWAWAPASGGRVCMSTGSTFAFGSAAMLDDSIAMNTRWAFGSAADNATNTYTNTTGTKCNTTVAGQTITNTVGVNIGGSSGFRDCAISDGSTAAKANFAFCANINSSGINYRGAAAHYEVMVPVATASTETYNFFMEPA